MRTLSREINLNGYTYVRVLSGKRTYVYEQRGVSNMRCFEVFEKNTLEPKEIMGKKYPKREVFPKNDDFGITAWTYCDYNKAIEKYNELESI